jgi:hypothetical protein
LLKRKRKNFFANGILETECAACDEPILNSDGFDMNEVLITRGDVSGNDHLKKAIMVPENCVLVHHGQCHVNVAHTTDGQRRCIRHLIKHESYDRIMYWLQIIDIDMTGRQAQDATRLVKEVRNAV